MNRLNEIARRCAAPFVRDVELKTEIENEVNDHLACAAAEAGEEEAVKRFGDPEPVAQELLLSNFNRLKWRSRFKLAVKILIVPAVLASVFFSVSRDTLGGVVIFRSLVTSSSGPDARMDELNFAVRLAGRPELTPEQFAKLLNLRPTIAEARAAFEKDRTQANRAIYINLLRSEQSPEFEGALKEAIAAEPDNALYYFMLSADLFKKAVDVDYDYGHGKHTIKERTIKDRKLLDQAMQYYLDGTRKPYMRSWLAEMYTPGGELIPTDGTVCGWLLQLTHNASWLLPHLSMLREVSRDASWYAKLLLEDKDPRAAEFLNAPKREALLLAQSDDPSYIAQLVVSPIAKQPIDENIPALLRQEGHEQAAGELERQCAAVKEPFLALRAGKADADTLIEVRGGIISKELLIPAGCVGLTSENLWPERKYTMAVLNSFTLVAMEAAVVAVIAILAVIFVFRHRGVYLMVLPGRTYLKLLVFGAVVPLAVWTVFSYVLYRNPMTCGTASFWSASVLTACAIWFTVLAVITLARRYRKLNGIRIPFPLLNGNLIVLLAGFVAVSTILMRPCLDLVRARAMKEDRMVFYGKVFTPAEDKATAVLRDGQIKILEEQVKQPIVLDKK